MSDRLFFQGRFVAATRIEAEQQLIDYLARKGYTPKGTFNIFPAPVQPYVKMIWWEFMQEVEQEG